MTGSGRCQALDTWETNVYVYIEDSHAHKPVLINLTSEDYKVIFWIYPLEIRGFVAWVTQSYSKTVIE